MEKKLAEQDLKPQQWWSVCEEVLTEHPEALPYKEIFRQGIAESLKAHELINEKWEKAQKFAGVKQEFRGASTGAQADEKTAQALFRLCFGDDARGKVAVDKGRTVIYFILEEQDYERVYAGFGRGLRERKREGEKTLGFMRSGQQVSYLVALRGGFLSRGLSEIPRSEIITLMNHEREHAVNKQIERGRENALVRFRLGQRELPEIAGKRLDAWEQEALPIERQAKDEVLAKSAELESRIEMVEIRRSKGDEFPFDPEAFLDAERKNFSESGGFYHDRFLKAHSSEENEKKRYERSVIQGFDAYRKLWELYLTERSSLPPDRMARYTLEQFPLHRWPAAVRLLEMHHREKEISA